MTSALVIDKKLRSQKKSNKDGSIGERDVLRKKIKQINRRLKHLKKDIDGQRSGRAYYNFLLQKRAEYTCMMVRESEPTNRDDVTESTASLSSSWSSFGELSLPSLSPKEDAKSSDEDDKASSENSHVSYESLRRKLNAVSRQLNECARIGKRYRRLLAKQTNYTEALIQTLGW